MPIYAYRCELCGHAYDALQKISDAPLVVCPSCGEPGLRKQVTAAGFQLKGSGWYVTDFRNPPAGKSAAPAAESDKAPSSADSKTASPPAADAASKSSGTTSSDDKPASPKAASADSGSKPAAKPASDSST